MTAVVGYVDKSILAEIDGQEIAVGIVTVPVTINGPGEKLDVLNELSLTVDPGPVEMRFDLGWAVDGHNCPGDTTITPYLRSGDDRMDLGHFACCAECQPTLPD